MKRSEAEKMVGQRVRVWTGLNGEYHGILDHLTNDRPWRGVVVIDGVAATATPPRRGKRIGETISVGHSSIKLIGDGPDSLGRTYTDALRDAIAWLEQKHEEVSARPPDYAAKDLWWINGNLDFYRKQLRLIEDGTWE